MKDVVCKDALRGPVWGCLGLRWDWGVGRGGPGLVDGDSRSGPRSPALQLPRGLGESGLPLRGGRVLPRTSSLSVSTRDVGIPRTGPPPTIFRPPEDACLFLSVAPHDS